MRSNQGTRRGRVGSCGRVCARAFSLLETGIVLVVVATVAAVALPRYAEGQGRYWCEAAAKRLSSDMELVRDRARSLGTPQTVQFYEDGYRLILRDATGAQSVQPVNFRDAPYNASLRWVKATTAYGDVTFNAFGQPDTHALIRVEGASNIRMVQITGGTGVSTATPQVTPTEAQAMETSTSGTKYPLSGTSIKLGRTVEFY